MRNFWDLVAILSGEEMTVLSRSYGKGIVHIKHLLQMKAVSIQLPVYRVYNYLYIYHAHREWSIKRRNTEIRRLFNPPDRLIDRYLANSYTDRSLSRQCIDWSIAIRYLANSCTDRSLSCQFMDWSIAISPIHGLMNRYLANSETDRSLSCKFIDWWIAVSCTFMRQRLFNIFWYYDYFTSKNWIESKGNAHCAKLGCVSFSLNTLIYRKIKPYIPVVLIYRKPSEIFCSPLLEEKICRKTKHRDFYCVLILCIQSKMMFVLLRAYTYTGQAKKCAWP